MSVEVRQFGSGEAMASGECFQDGEDIQEMLAEPEPRESSMIARLPGTLSANWRTRYTTVSSTLSSWKANFNRRLNGAVKCHTRTR